MNGKKWNKIFRAHKMPFEALWIILWPLLLDWCKAKDYEINRENIDHIVCEIVDAVNRSEQASGLLNEELITPWTFLLPFFLKSVANILTSFDRHTEVQCIPFWRQYMEMVVILLRFTRAIWDGNWTPSCRLSQICCHGSQLATI